MLTWKIVVLAEASVLYIYIYKDKKKKKNPMWLGLDGGVQLFVHGWLFYMQNKGTF